MSAGIAVYNTDKQLVINENYVNLWLSRKVSITGTGTFTGTFDSGETMAAVGGVDAAGGIDAYCENSETGYTCKVMTYRAGMCIYIFSTEQPNREHGYGLQVFNASGKLVYDSSNPSARVILSGTARDVSIPSGHDKVAIAVGQDTQIKQHIEQYDAKVGIYSSTPRWVTDPTTGFQRLDGYDTTYYGDGYVTMTDNTFWENFKINAGKMAYVRHTSSSKKTGPQPYGRRAIYSSASAADEIYAAAHGWNAAWGRSPLGKNQGFYSYVDTASYIVLDVTDM